MTIAAFVVVAALAAPAPDAALQDAVDAYVAADRTRDIAVALVTPAGIEFAAAGDGVDADTPFEIGSITKTFTGSLLAALIADGTVTAETPIGTLVPSAYPLDPAVASITLRELATHTSGLPRLPESPAMTGRLLLHPANPYAGSTDDEIYTELTRITEAAIAKRGEEHYSNLGVALLGRVLEQAAGTRYETLVDTHILTPRGMTASAFERAAAGGHRTNLQPTPDWQLDGYNPAGGLVSTARDMTAYLKVEMGEPPEANLSWASSQKDGMRWHNGRTGGYASFAGFLPDRQRAIVVLTSGGASPDAFGAALLRDEEPAIDRPEPEDAFWLGFTIIFTALAPLALILLARQPFARLDYLTAVLDAAWLLALTWTLGAWLQIPIAVWYAVATVAFALAIHQARRIPKSPWLHPNRPWHNVAVVVGIPVKLLLLYWVAIRL